MTTTTVARAAPAPIGATVVACGGCALLLARPWLGATGRSPAATAVAFLALAAVGVAAPRAHTTSRDAHDSPDARVALVVTVFGVATVGAAALVVSGRPPVPIAATAVWLTVLAAVAEEAFFRRYVYALVRPAGAGVAIGTTASLFALAHVSVYGWWVLPVDLAVGSLLGWQREAAGTWWAPAVTHVVANLCVVL
jgi:membrane protease YdiL (CAAX protease family)